MDLANSCAEVEKLRAEVQTCRDQIVYNRRRASGRYTRAVDEHLKADLGHRREALA